MLHLSPRQDAPLLSNARMAKLVNVAVSEAVGVRSLRVRVSLRAHQQINSVVERNLKNLQVSNPAGFFVSNLLPILHSSVRKVKSFVSSNVSR